MVVAVPEPRLTNTAGDVILTVELLCFWWDWQRRQPKSASAIIARTFQLYSFNLLAASVFTGSGAVLHIVDPLPQQVNTLWVVFVVSCAVTPILFPAILASAVYPQMSPRSWLRCCAWMALSFATHAGLLATRADLSKVLALPVMEFGGHRFDGRSIGGKPYGIEFDLLSSLPCLKGEGLFLHAGLFANACLVVVIVCAPVGLRWETPQKGVEVRLVRRLMLSMVIMLVGAVSLAPIAAMVGIGVAFDMWHVAMFTVMAMAYSALRQMISSPGGPPPVASQPPRGEGGQEPSTASNGIPVLKPDEVSPRLRQRRHRPTFSAQSAGI